MFHIDPNNYPLERLICRRNKFSYKLPVRTRAGRTLKLLCEFQTHSDLVFNAPQDTFANNETIQVRITTLRGFDWVTCVLTYVEEHPQHCLYQFSLI